MSHIEENDEGASENITNGVGSYVETYPNPEAGSVDTVQCLAETMVRVVVNGVSYTGTEPPVFVVLRRPTDPQGYLGI